MGVMITSCLHETFDEKFTRKREHKKSNTTYLIPSASIRASLIVLSSSSSFLALSRAASSFTWFACACSFARITRCFSSSWRLKIRSFSSFSSICVLSRVSGASPSLEEAKSEIPGTGEVFSSTMEAIVDLYSSVSWIAVEDIFR